MRTKESGGEKNSKKGQSKKSSIFCWQEQYGMVLVEAMVSGLPIITTNSGSIPEVIGNAAILIPPADRISLYNALVQLIDNPQRAKKIARIARKRAEEYFDTRKIAQMIEEVYSHD